MDALVGASAGFTAGGEAVGTQGFFGAGGSFGMGGTISNLFSGVGGTLLQGALTGASAFSQVSAGKSTAGLMTLNAQQAELNAQMETLKGRESALTIKAQLNKDLAGQNALFSSRGVLQGEGSSLAAQSLSKKNATADLNVAQLGADVGSESDRLRAAQYRTEGKTAIQTGNSDALATVGKNRVVQSLLAGL